MSLEDELALLQLLIVTESEALLQGGQRVVQPLQLLLQNLQLPRVGPQTPHQSPQGATLGHAPAQLLQPHAHTEREKH